MFSIAASWRDNFPTPDGTGPIWFDDVRCTGIEVNLFDCPRNAIGSHNCGHHEDLGLMCSGTTCPQGAIRLRGGTAIQGRVEICYNHVWGTVCENQWSKSDAQVACRQLGFNDTFRGMLKEILVSSARCVPTLPCPMTFIQIHCSLNQVL